MNWKVDSPRARRLMTRNHPVARIRPILPAVFGASLASQALSAQRRPSPQPMTMERSAPDCIPPVELPAMLSIRLAHRRIARGMTLVELMIVVAMLAILAAIVVPMFGTTSDMARTEAMASNAAQIKSMVIHHAGVKDVALSPQGYPTTVDGSWFKMGHLPEHSWTGSPLLVEVVTAANDVVYPATKTFDVKVPGATNAWYNTANGHFVVRIPSQSSAGATLQLFNNVNKTGATALNQTTE